MIRRNFNITDNQDKRLKKGKKESGLSRSEIVRRALDNYFESKKTKK